MTVVAELPSGRLVAGGDSQGFFISDDGGRTWLSRNVLRGGADPFAFAGRGLDPRGARHRPERLGPDAVRRRRQAGPADGGHAALGRRAARRGWSTTAARASGSTAATCPAASTPRSRATSRLIAIADRGPYAADRRLFAGDMTGCVWTRPLVAGAAWSLFACLPDPSRSPIRAVAVSSTGDVIIATSRMGLAGSRGGGTHPAAATRPASWRLAVDPSCTVGLCGYIVPTSPLIMFAAASQSVEEVHPHARRPPLRRRRRRPAGQPGCPPRRAVGRPTGRLAAGVRRLHGRRHAAQRRERRPRGRRHPRSTRSSPAPACPRRGHGRRADRLRGHPDPGRGGTRARSRRPGRSSRWPRPTAVDLDLYGHEGAALVRRRHERARGRAVRRVLGRGAERRPVHGLRQGRALGVPAPAAGRRAAAAAVAPGGLRRRVDLPGRRGARARDGLQHRRRPLPLPRRPHPAAAGRAPGARPGPHDRRRHHQGPLGHRARRRDGPRRARPRRPSAGCARRPARLGAVVAAAPARQPPAHGPGDHRRPGDRRHRQQRAVDRPLGHDDRAARRWSSGSD